MVVGLVLSNRNSIAHSPRAVLPLQHRHGDYLLFAPGTHVDCYGVCAQKSMEHVGVSMCLRGQAIIAIIMDTRYMGEGCSQQP